MRPSYRNRVPSPGAKAASGHSPGRSRGGAAGPRPLAVSELLRILNSSLVRDFPSLVVKGEVVDPALSRNGHFYFRLRDPAGELRAVIWRSEVQRAGALPKAGEEITVRGSLTVYPQRGDLQMKVLAFHRSGLGELLAGLEALKELLRREGHLDRPKRALPPFPLRVGLVTSLGSAVLHDVFESLRQRNPSVELLLSPSAVTGPSAAAELRQATERLWDHVEVIIIARGGGSFEELLPFSDEGLLRTVLASPVPVVAAVGHGSDSVLLDLVADCSVPTPTSAAVAVVPDRSALLQQLGRYRLRADEALERKLAFYAREASRLEARLRLQNPRLKLVEASDRFRRLAESLEAWGERVLEDEGGRLRQLSYRLRAASPRESIASEKERWSEWRRRCQTAMIAALRERRSEVQSTARRCRDLGPESILARGFGMLLAQGRPVVSSRGRSPGEELEVRLSDGRLRVRLIEALPDAPESSV